MKVFDLKLSGKSFFFFLINSFNFYVKELIDKGEPIAQGILNNKQMLFLSIICHYYYEGGSLSDMDSLKSFIKNRYGNEFSKDTDIATYKSAIKRKKWISIDEMGAIKIMPRFSFRKQDKLLSRINIMDETEVSEIR